MIRPKVAFNLWPRRHSTALHEDSSGPARVSWCTDRGLWEETRVEGLGFRGSGFRVLGFGFWALGFRP